VASVYVQSSKVAEIRTGGIVGEMTALGLSLRCTASVKCNTMCICVLIQSAELLRQLRSFPEDFRRFQEVMETRLVVAHSLLGDQSVQKKHSLLRKLDWLRTTMPDMNNANTSRSSGDSPRASMHSIRALSPRSAGAPEPEVQSVGELASRFANAGFAIQEKDGGPVRNGANAGLRGLAKRNMASYLRRQNDRIHIAEERRGIARVKNGQISTPVPADKSYLVEEVELASSAVEVYGEERQEEAKQFLAEHFPSLPTKRGRVAGLPRYTQQRETSRLLDRCQQVYQPLRPQLKR